MKKKDRRYGHLSFISGSETSVSSSNEPPTPTLDTMGGHDSEKTITGLADQTGNEGSSSSGADSDDGLVADWSNLGTMRIKEGTVRGRALSF